MSARSAAFVTLSARSVGRGGRAVRDMYGAERELMRDVARHNDLAALARRPRVREDLCGNQISGAPSTLSSELGMLDGVEPDSLVYFHTGADRKDDHLPPAAAVLGRDLGVGPEVLATS